MEDEDTDLGVFAFEDTKVDFVYLRSDFTYDVYKFEKLAMLLVASLMRPMTV